MSYERVTVADLFRAELESQDPDKLLKVGQSLLRKERYDEAVIALEHAHRQCPDDARVLSFLGLALLLGSRPGRGAIKMCEQAVSIHEYDPDLLHNLGHAYLLSGNRRMAFEALSEACALDQEHSGVRQTLVRMGQRKPPVFGFLHRDHPLNIHAGKLFKRLGWR